MMKVSVCQLLILLLRKLRVIFINCFLHLVVLLYSLNLYSSSLLDGGSDATFAVSVLTDTGFSMDESQGYLSYGLSDNWTIALQERYRNANKILINELSVKRKLLDRYFSYLQFSVSAECSNFSTFAPEVNEFSFVSNKVATPVASKVDDFFVIFTPSLLFGSSGADFEVIIALGYDYSEYTTIMFGKTYSPFGDEWKLMLSRNIIGDFDVNLEYINSVDNNDKLSIGLWYRFSI